MINYMVELLRATFPVTFESIKYVRANEEQNNLSLRLYMESHLVQCKLYGHFSRNSCSSIKKCLLKLSNIEKNNSRVLCYL